MLIKLGPNRYQFDGWMVQMGPFWEKVYENLNFFVCMGKPRVKIYTRYYELVKTVGEKVRQKGITNLGNKVCILWGNVG